MNKEFMQENKETIIDLLSNIEREGANIDGLIRKLESSDFFTAPASTRYHNNTSGGLADHSLNVYYNLKSLVNNKKLNEIISEESIIICGLLHDMSKINHYEPSVRNKKVYSDGGSKYDEMGRFDWVAEKSWAVIPEKDRFSYGNHEQNAEFMVRHFIPLKIEESIAILHHHSGLGWDSTKQNLSSIMSNNPLLVLLHTADMISTFVDEEVFE